MVLLILFVLFVGVPALEIYVVIQIGQAIGILPTLALMILDALIGSALMRSQGRAVWRRFNEALASGRPPGREVLDGALVIVGGAFLIAPGFVTDIFGAFLLLPPTRALARRLIVRHFTGRIVGGLAGPWARRAASARRRPRAPRGGEGDVEGTAVDIDHPELRP